MTAPLRKSLARALSILFLGGASCIAQTPAVAKNSTTNPAANRQVQANYGKLPLTFEGNIGQSDPRVNFLAHGSGYSLFLTSGQMVLSLRPSSISKTQAATAATSSTVNQKSRTPETSANAVIQINLLGANKNP